MNPTFTTYLREACGVTETDRVLVAVSGGMDSTLLCHLFKAIGQPFGIAHCNYQLRGKASDEDEDFVRQLAKKLEVSFWVQRFDTYPMATEAKKSIQVLARELRYDWLENTRQTQHFQYLATAHHLNDAMETVLFNLTKGCGIQGLHGILPFKGAIVRPLLFATKTAIRNMAESLQIQFRMDESNETDQYTRNFIRHQIVPRLQSINPNVEQTFSENIDRFRAVESLYFQAIEHIKKEVCHYKNKRIHIDLPTLSKNEAAKTILYEILKPFDFTNSVVEQIFQAKDSFAGKQFFSKTHLAVLDRTDLIVAPIKTDSAGQYLLHSTSEQLHFDNQTLHLQVLTTMPTDFLENANTCFLDFDALLFPLTIRKWQVGDTFQPYGMKGQHKKVSHFFRQQKFSKHDKDAVWILESDGKIVWIIGHRTDERFKIHAATTRILKIICVR